jgi:hypothetical protein
MTIKGDKHAPLALVGTDPIKTCGIYNCDNPAHLKRPYPIDPDACVRLCEAIAEFWGDGICDAPIWPGAYLTEQDVPIRDLVRAAVGWRKP